MVWLNRKSGHSRLLFSLVIVVLTILSGVFVALYGIGYQELIVVASFLLGIVSLFGRNGIRNGYIVWILLFVLGYRSIPIHGAFRLHPLVIGIMWLFVMWLLRVGIVERRSVRLGVPKVVWVFSFFWMWGLLIGVINGISFDVILSHVTNFIILIPIFVVSDYVFVDTRYLKGAVIAFWGAATFIAFVGTVEYLFPNTLGLLSGYISNTSLAATPTGFGRAQFSFFGSQIATFICVLAIPFGAALWGSQNSLPKRMAIFVSAMVVLFGIYIGGYRSIWLTTIIVLAIVNILSKKWYTTFFLIVIAVLLFFAVPQEAIDRFSSLTTPFMGDIQDGSSLKRSERALAAIEASLRAPWGRGWGSSGWVHSDVLQLAADTSIVGMLVFVFWYFDTFKSLLKTYHKLRSNMIASQIASFSAVGILFVSQAVYVLPQIIIPTWFVWALGQHFVNDTRPGTYD